MNPGIFRSQPRQTYLFVLHRRSGRDIRFGFSQGHAQRPPRPSRQRGSKASKRGLSAEQIPITVAVTARVRPWTPSCRGSRPSALWPPWAARSPRPRTFAAMEDRPLPRSRDPPDSNSTCCPLPETQSLGTRTSHQQRERLPWPSQRMGPALPRRRHQEPSELFELTQNDRSSRSRHDSRSLDHGSRGNGLDHRVLDYSKIESFRLAVTPPLVAST